MTSPAPRHREGARTSRLRTCSHSMAVLRSRSEAWCSCAGNKPRSSRGSASRVPLSQGLEKPGQPSPALVLRTIFSSEPVALLGRSCLAMRSGSRRSAAAVLAHRSARRGPANEAPLPGWTRRGSSRTSAAGPSIRLRMQKLATQRPALWRRTFVPLRSGPRNRGTRGPQLSRPRRTRRVLRGGRGPFVERVPSAQPAAPGRRLRGRHRIRAIPPFACLPSNERLHCMSSIE